MTLIPCTIFVEVHYKTLSRHTIHITHLTHIPCTQYAYHANEIYIMHDTNMIYVRIVSCTASSRTLDTAHYGRIDLANTSNTKFHVVIMVNKVDAK